MRLPTRLLRRRPEAHKGDFGHIFILAGSLRYSGAAVLCADSAMRAGAGLVTLGVPQGLARPLIKVKPKEVMMLPLPETGEGTLSSGGYGKIKDFAREADILVVGPGLTRNASAQALARKVISGIDRPMVIDADGLNALAGHAELLRSARGIEHNEKILTPHPGEMAGLAGISVKKVQADRMGVARDFAGEHRVTVVLKGHNTLVADYRDNIYINKTGNPGMATAGCGDVLTGMIAALMGQGLSAFEASKYAVYLHGLAGDLAAKEKTVIGMVASDIIDKIPEAVKRCS